MTSLDTDPIDILEKNKESQSNTPASTQHLFQFASRTFGSRRYPVEIFEKYSKKIRNRNQFQPETVKEIGKLFAFRYRPITFSKLPYFDASPLIFTLSIPSKTEVIGMNFHYLSPQNRLFAYYSMYNLLTDKNFGDDSRLRLYYDIMKSQKKYARNMVCIRKYKTERIRSKVYEIHPKYWESSLVVPTQMFIKRREATVYMDTNKQIRKILGNQ